MAPLSITPSDADAGPFQNADHDQRLWLLAARYLALSGETEASRRALQVAWGQQQTEQMVA